MPVSLRGKFVFAGATYGTHPFFGKFFKGNSRGNVAVRISLGRVIDIAANTTNILFHKRISLLYLDSITNISSMLFSKKSEKITGMSIWTTEYTSLSVKEKRITLTLIDKKIVLYYKAQLKLVL